MYPDFFKGRRILILINIRIRVSNIERIKEALLKAFGTIHLFDEEIKMRIRYSIQLLYVSFGFIY